MFQPKYQPRPDWGAALVMIAGLRRRLSGLQQRAEIARNAL
jgi:hypothetical protein